MQNDEASKPKNYLIHLIYAGSLLLAVMAILIYLGWAKHQKTLQLQKCIAGAYTDYEAEWAAACRSQAELSETSLSNCLNEAAARAKLAEIPGMPSSNLTVKNIYDSLVAQCRSYYSSANPNPNCMLQTNTGKDLNNRLSQNQELCIKINS